MEQTLGEYFMERLKTHKSPTFSQMHWIYYNLFEMMELDDLDGVLNEYLKDSKKNEYWFGAFHKSIRQCGFFGCSGNEYWREFTRNGERDQERISGHLDSILWNVIHIDEEFLYDFMVDVFADFNHLKKKENAKKTRKSKS